MQTAEAVKLHKMQKVAELAQLAHMDKIRQKAKLGKMVLSHQTSENSETRKNGQTSWVGCFPLNYALFSCGTSKKKMFCLFAANHADFSLISLNPLFLWFLGPNYAFFSFLAPKTCFGLFAKLGCSGLYVTKSNVLLLLLLNYSGFSVMTPKRCFRLFVAKFVLFSALFHWRLSFELFAAKLPVISLFRLLPLNWAIFSLNTPKKGFMPVFS